MKNTTSSHRRRISFSASLAALLFVAALVYLPAFFSTKAYDHTKAAKNSTRDYYDIRTDKESADKMAAFRARANHTAGSVADIRDGFVSAESALRSQVPTLKVEYNPELHSPEVIGPDPSMGRASLIGRTNARRADVLRSFIKENAGLFGVTPANADSLKEFADYTNPLGDLSFAVLEQDINGIPVFNGEVKAGFNKQGEMFRVVNNLAPGLEYASLSQDFGDPAAAVRVSASQLKIDPASLDLKANAAATNDLKTTFGQGDWATTAEKMYFPTEPGIAVPAWRVLIWQPKDAFYVIVDSATGIVLWKKSITNDQTQSATYNVYAATNNLGQALDSPSPGSPSPIFPGSPDPATVPSYQPEAVSRTNVTLIGNEGPLAFNNLGWMTDNINGGNGLTDGNNVEAGVDLVAPDGVDAPQPGTGRVFNFNYTPSVVTGASVPPYTGTETGDPPTNPDYRSGVVTHLFYLTNRYHDALYQVGFTEQARNFQNDNFGRGGQGSDRVSAEAQDSSGSNNANFFTPADGQRGLMQMYLFTNGTAPRRDGSLDSNVVWHELTHGVSNRLIGNGGGLGSTQSRGMGEGWSDLFAFLLASKTTDPVDRVYSMGGYATYKCCGLTSFTTNYYYGIRRFPYAIKSVTGGPLNRPHNPLTFADIDPAQISLNDGAYPSSPLAGGSATEVHNEGELWAMSGIEVWSRLVTRLGHDAGTLRTLQLYTDAMKLSPLNPTFLQERDSIVAASQALGGSDTADVWAAFATRGMGVSASNPAGNTVVQAFDLPNLSQSGTILVNDSAGNNNGFPEPGEQVSLTIGLANNTGMSAAGVTLQLVGGGSANFGTIANGNLVGMPVSFTVPSNTVCGTSTPLTLNVNSSLGPITFNRSIIVGAPVQALSEDFDGVAAPALPAGWTSTSVLGGINFATATTNSDTGPNSAFAPDTSAAASAADLTSPSMAIMASAASLSFRHRFDTEAAWDGGVLEIKIGGGSFVDIVAAGGSFIANGYNGVLTAASPSPTYTPNPLNGRSGWSGASGGFITTTVQLPTAAAGQNVQFRWRMGSDDNTSGVGSNPGWYIDTVKVIGGYTCSSVPTVKAPFDFDGDHKTDISIFRPSAGEWWYSRSSDGVVRAGQFGAATDVITPGDFTGDGKTDIALWRPSDGSWYVLRSEDNSYFSFPFGTAGDVPMPADFDGDGKTDAAIFRPSTGTWFIPQSGGGGTSIFQFGLSGDLPVSADYDGDGKADPAIVRTVGGSKQWWVARSAAGVMVITFGTATDQTVPGDYTGDGKTDVAVFRPSTGEWFVLRSEDFSFFSFPFGTVGDVPAPGDYDGDGKFDAAVFRPSSATWFVNRTGGSGTLIAGFGLPTDKPVPNAFVR